MQTNLTRSLAPSLTTLLLAAIPFGSLSLAVAQQTTTTSTQPKGITKSIDIETAHVIYVSGDNVVLRNSDSSLQLLAMAPGTTISVDGKPVATRDLKLGTEISHVHINSVQQSVVTEVTQIDGTVNRYTIPSHATFHADDGSEIPVSALRRGMRVSATVVRTSTMDTHSRQTTVSGSIATPPQSGTLLIYGGPAHE